MFNAISDIPRRILVIDDNDAIHNDFRKTLGGSTSPSSKLTGAKAALFGDSSASTNLASKLPKFELETALQGEEGLGKLQAALRTGKPFTVAFVDMRMPPGWDGVQTIEKLWEADGDLQVVICTAYSDYSWEEISDKLGVSDRLLILKKPFDAIEVSQLAVALSEKWSLKQRADMKLEEVEKLVELRTAELTHAATHDKLTGLPNRALMRDRLNQAIKRHERDVNNHFALLFLDFDRFKVINDSLGHDVGDELLKAISIRLADCLRQTDSICKPDSSSAGRLGGDEFIILADGLKDIGDAELVAKRLAEALRAPYLLHGHHVISLVSIGITTSAIGYTNAEDMVRDADTAMYHAKNSGRGCCMVFDQSMHDKAVARLTLETELQTVLQRQELVVHYQPIVSLSSGKIHGLEALVRWNHPQRGLLSPDHFIPCSEETGMIIPIGDWVLTEACQQLKQLQVKFPSLSMSVNVSGRQLATVGLVSRIAAIIRDSGVKPTTLTLEITETVMIQNAQAIIPILQQLRDLGVGLHMDDFGTGYSSLSCLHQFPLTGIKIDKHFVHSIGQRRDFAAVVQGIVTMARNLSKTLIAEGVETLDQVAMLQTMECDLAQGFLFQKPMPVGELQAYLNAHPSLKVAA